MTRLLASCVAFAIAAGCARGPGAPGSLVVASVRQPATSLLFVAEGAGCFARERLALEERSFELGRDALGLLLDGRADVAIAFETPLLRAALSDPRLRVLSRLHTSTRNTRLVARREAGIRTFADLRGRRLGLSRGTNADFFAEVALATGGVPRASTAVADVAPEKAPDALARGEIDAAVLSDPYAAQAEERLGPEASTLLSDLYAEASLLITRAEVLAAKERALRALLRGLRCGERHAAEEPERARALVLARFPELPAAALDAQLGRVTRGLGLDNVLVDVLRRERDWLAAPPATSGAPDLRALVEPRLLEQVHPEAVTLLPVAGGLPW